MKDFFQETATAGPKLVTSLKEVPNSTKLLKRKLQKSFQVKTIKKAPEIKEEKKAEDTTSICQRIFGSGQNNATEADIMAEVMETKKMKDEFYKLMAQKQ